MSRSEHKWGPTQHNRARINKQGQMGTSKRTETSMNEERQVRTRAGEHNRGRQGPTSTTSHLQHGDSSKDPLAPLHLPPQNTTGAMPPHPATVALRDYNHQPNGWFAKCVRVEEDGEEVMQVMQEVIPPQYAHPPTDNARPLRHPIFAFLDDL
jgi:hypothetical protein